MRDGTQQDICITEFTAVLFPKAEQWKQSKRPPNHEQIKKMLYVSVWQNIFQFQKGMKFWYMLQDKWTYETR